MLNPSNEHLLYREKMGSQGCTFPYSCSKSYILTHTQKKGKKSFVMERHHYILYMHSYVII